MDDLDELELPPAALRLIAKAVRKAYRQGERAAQEKFDDLLERMHRLKELNGTTEVFKHQWKEELHKRDHGKFATKEGGKGDGDVGTGSVPSGGAGAVVDRDNVGTTQATEGVREAGSVSSSAGNLTAIPESHLLDGLHADVPTGLWSQVVSKVKSAAQRVHERLVLVTPTLLKFQDLLTFVGDHPDDLKRFGYKPVTSGVAGHDTPDALRDATGIGGTLGARLAAHVLAKVVSWIRTQGAVDKAVDDSDPYAELGSALADVLAILAEEFGGEAPDAATVATALRAMESPQVEPIVKSKDATGHEHRGKGPGGGQFTSGGGGNGGGGSQAQVKPAKPTTAAPKKPRTAPEPLPDRFDRNALGRVVVNADVQRWCEGTNEPAVAKAVNGKALPDNEPMDVILPPPPDSPAHGLELKTMVSNTHRQIRMKSDAQTRKRAWRRKNKVPVHTVVIDDTAVYNALGPGKHDLSKRRVFYRRGFGSFKVDRMHEVEGGIAGLQALLDMPTRQLPPGAWKPKPVAVAKGFDPNEKRDATGKWSESGGGGSSREGESDEHHATASRWVAASNISESLREVYTLHMTHILAKMPSGSRQAALEALAAGSVTFHSDVASVTAALEKTTGKKERSKVGGFVAHTRGDDRAHLHVDGDGGTGAGETARGIYAHELGHAVDVGRRFSEDPKWESAWKSEIFNGRKLLSRYARTSATEGFAEFHRALCEQGVEATRAAYPKCAKYFESKGLL